MSGFLANLNSRHSGIGINIEPRQKSKFETAGHSGIESVENVNSIPYSSNPSGPGRPESKQQDIISSQSESIENPVSQYPKKIYKPQNQDPTRSIKPASRENQTSSENFNQEKPGVKPEKRKEIYQSSEEGRLTTQKIIIPPQDKMNLPQIKNEQHAQKSSESEKIVKVEKKSEPITNQLENRFKGNQVLENDTFDPSVVSEIRIKKGKDESGQLIPPPVTHTDLIHQSDIQTAKRTLQNNKISSASEETTVKVSIGKIEIKAINQTPSEKIIKRKPAPIMSLEEYLNNQNTNNR